MKGPSPVSPPEPSDQAPAIILDSWKEIASYVKRDVSTVQRWEKREGMPVHRHVHDKRGSVYALSSELDASCNPQTTFGGEEQEHVPETSEETEGDRAPSGTPWARRRCYL